MQNIFITFFFFCIVLCVINKLVTKALVNRKMLSSDDNNAYHNTYKKSSRIAFTIKPGMECRVECLPKGNRPLQARCLVNLIGSN